MSRSASLARGMFTKSLGYLPTPTISFIPNRYQPHAPIINPYKVEEYDQWLTKILRAEQPAIVLIDELSSLGGMTGRSFPRGYFLLSKQGGKHGISLISCTQEAAYIPRVTLGQTTHLVRFRLINRHDAKKVDELLRRPEKDWGNDPWHKYGFFHRRTDQDGPGHYYQNHQEFFAS